MQTFLPYPDFVKSAKCLDRLRLGKQRVECLQILRALTGISSGWINHPATKMWAGYDQSLIYYGLIVCKTWRDLGYKDTCGDKLNEYWKVNNAPKPHWLGNEAFHASHRSNLLRKNAIYYQQFGWVEPDNLPYVWHI